MKTMLRAIFFVIEAFLLIVITLLIDFTTPISTEQTLFIKKGSATRIISDLSKQNLNLTIFDAKILSRLGVVKQGYIDLGATKFAKIDFLKALVDAKPALMNITIIPGETTIITLQNIAKANKFDFDKLESDYNRTVPFYEGFLFAETYSLAKGLNQSQILQNLVKISQENHAKLKKELNFDGNDTAWNEILVKASIIQKEAAGADEMPIVASVIENRLKIGMRLEMDGTLNYGVYSHVRVTPERIKTDTSSYNTYLNDGIPAHPVCIVSKEAVKAVLNPAQTEYLYFMRDKRTGKHNFAKTYNEHLKNIEIQRRIR